MTHSIFPYTLRSAWFDELTHAVAIDDAAAVLFAQAGLDLELPITHPFVVAERRCWQRALDAGRLWFACDETSPVGFAALDCATDAAYLQQLSVHPDHGRRGLGAALLERAYRAARERGAPALWLTTYAHLPWNKPYYERHGFVVVPEAESNPLVRELLEEQRQTLPHPLQRVAMRRLLP
jgi:GNAT superfamily N-acetyltransferase